MKTSSLTSHVPPSLPFQPSPLLKRINCNWRNSVMLSGLVIAVIGVAASILASAPFTAVAFGAVSIVIFFGAYFVNESVSEAELISAIDELKAKNASLVAVQKQLEDDTKTLQGEYVKIQTINKAFQQTVSDMKGRITDLEKVNAGLQNTNVQLTTRANDLSATNADLSKRVADLRQALKIFKEEVSAFAEQNFTLGKHIGAFTEEVSELDVKNAKLEQLTKGFDDTFDQNVLELSQQILLAQTASKGIFDFLQKQNTYLGSQLTTLQSSLEKITKLDDDIGKKIARLAEEETKLAARTGELQKIQEQLQHTEKDFAREKDGFAKEKTKLDQVRKEYAAEEQKLEEVRLRIQTSLKQFQDLEGPLQNQTAALEQKQKDLEAALETKFAAKKAELIALKTQIEGSISTMANSFDDLGDRLEADVGGIKREDAKISKQFKEIENL